MFGGEMPYQVKTREALADPKLGDRYTEMYAFWAIVVEVDGNRVAILRASAPCTLPDDGAQEVFSTHDDFRAWIRRNALYLVDRRGPDYVHGWFRGWRANVSLRPDAEQLYPERSRP